MNECGCRALNAWQTRTPEELFGIFDAFYAEATRVRAKYAGQITLLIGFETEWIRDESRLIIENLQAKYDFHLFVGSVHHVDSVPIDFDRAMYDEAVARAGGSEQHVFELYFDDQYEMLTALRPPVVGHFDLIRLKSDLPDGSFHRWPTVWHKICRNLQFIAQYGGLLELNSAGLRKGLHEPYPGLEICQVSPTPYLHLQTGLMRSSISLLSEASSPCPTTATRPPMSPLATLECWTS